jgi:membrane protein implicated in regulation of membrane protease activity
LAIAEIFTSGFFLLCFAVGAVIAAIASYFGVPPLGQFGVFVVASAGALLLLRPFANRVTSVSTPVGSDRLVGKAGIVVEVIDPARGVGVVRVEHETWSADSAEGVPIATGTMVRVVGIEGTHLKVRAGLAE